MTKFKNKFKGLYKGMFFAVAAVMCFSFVPTNAVAALAETVNVNDLNTIVIESAPKNSVVKGGKYSAPIAKFKSSSNTFVIGDAANATPSGWESSVVITYKNTTDTETFDADSYDASESIYGTFTPKRVGTYVISYNVTDNLDNKYTYEYEVECEVSDAYFKFSNFDEGIIPSVYDLGYLEALGKGYTDIVLPLPTVYDENDNLIKDGNADLEYFLDKNEATGQSKTSYIIVSVSGGSTEGIAVTRDENNKFIIDGDTIKNTSGVGNYTISYSFYQNSVFVTSTEKTFEVSNKHFTKDDKPGYTLNASWATTPFTTAMTGVKTELPAVKGVTSSTDKPASETVEVSYTISVARRVNGNYIDSPSSLIKDEETGKYYFQAEADGDYRISYVVKDFYGNIAKSETTTFYVTGVKDQQLPTVYVYDGNPDYSKDSDDNYISAKAKSKSSAKVNNFVVYAIGATDNAAKLEDMRLTRLIRDAGSTVRVETNDYAQYNLIFNFNGYTQFISDNFSVLRDMLKDDVDTSNEAAIATWLKDHKYLIVTNSYTTNPVDKSSFTFAEGTILDSEDKNFDLESIKTQLVSQGFAYINYNYTFTTQTYRIVYEARDAYAIEKGDRAQLILDMDLKTAADYGDNEKPEITGPKDLQAAYLPTDKITFAEPSASDNEDDYMQLVKAYRYLSSSKDVVSAGESLDFDPKTGSFDGITDSNASKGWTNLTADKNGKYNIDLSEKPENAAFVELIIYAVDDFGNVGIWNKVITIANTADEEIPTIYQVEKPNNASLMQGDVITLPTIYFTDDLVDYMTAKVSVYHVSATGVKRQVAASNMNSYADAYTERFVLNAGSFVASYAGKYQVVITAKDSANHSVATFFEYTVSEKTVAETPVIDNITSETITLEVGQQRYLPSPSVSISTSGDYGYIGIQDTDDAKTASYYTVNVLTAESSNYQLDKYYFRALSKGKYTLQYNVYLLQYAKADLAPSQAAATANQLYLAADGRLKIKASSGDDFYVYVNFDGVNATVAANTSLQGTGTKYSGTLDNVSIIPLKSEIQTINVKDTTKPVINMDLSHISSSYPQMNTTGVVLPRISATDISAEGINPEKSYVRVTISRASGTTTINTTKMNEWEDDSKYENGELRLKFDTNGTYTILYHVEDYSGNYSELTKTVASGDNYKPTIEVKDGFLNKQADEYAINDKLSLDVSKLVLNDEGGTTSENLLKSISIKLENVTENNKVIKNNGEVDPEQGIYSYEFDLKTAGEYKLTVTIKDEAGWTTDEIITITVQSSTNNPVLTYQVIGIILIVVFAVALAGVIGYFIYSKVKADKKNKIK